MGGTVRQALSLAHTLVSTPKTSARVQGSGPPSSTPMCARMLLISLCWSPAGSAAPPTAEIINRGVIPGVAPPGHVLFIENTNNPARVLLGGGCGVPRLVSVLTFEAFVKHHHVWKA